MKTETTNTVLKILIVVLITGSVLLWINRERVLINEFDKILNSLAVTEQDYQSLPMPNTNITSNDEIAREKQNEIDLVESTISDKETTIEGRDVRGEEIACLQKNIFFEARNQPLRGRIMVGMVTKNRVESRRYPKTYCGVVRQGIYYQNKIVLNRCQFSWYCDGNTDNPNLTSIIDRQQWRDAKEIAVMVYDDEIEDISNGATHYHADYVLPTWALSPKMTKITKVGVHIFYKYK